MNLETQYGESDDSEKEVFSDTPTRSVPTTADYGSYDLTTSPYTANGSPLRSWSRDASARRSRRAARLQSVEILRAKLAGSPNGSSDEDDQQEQLDIDKTLNILPIPNFTIKNTWRGLDTNPRVSSGSKSASGYNEVDVLRKELTDCRIQLRLQKELLLERYGEESSAMEFLHRQFNQDESEREQEHLKKQLDDLVSAFEGLQGQLDVLQRDHQEWKRVADDILGVLEEGKAVPSVIRNAKQGGLGAKLRTIGLETERLVGQLESNSKSPRDDDLPSAEQAVLQQENEKLLTENSQLMLELNRLKAVESELAKSRDLEKQLEQLKIETETSDKAVIKQLEEQLKSYRGIEEKLNIKDVSYQELEQSHQLATQQIEQLRQEKDTLETKFNELQQNKVEKSDQSVDSAELSALKKDLELSLIKQRQINSEKIKLNYKIDELSQQLAKQKNYASVANQKWNDYLTSDVNFQTHLIQILSDILDKKSIKEAAAKILQLANRDELRLDDTDTMKLRETILEYDLAAVRTIVADHGELSKQVSIEKPVGDESLRLRIEELTKRWKKAEETLAFERKQSEKRFQELERENRKLRQ
ncbi:hypothetical protein OGAPHI_000303 [Ogataea philodendri]|uniref:Uncharacterized protein n=1 Tax=Ogataea philodendri TaxID=1378263 RepID=A0A9P8TAR0_9ASCO|nr:uncharacterized protein OGAPHI_000303 [Ogataea philodendri]KAH3671600.1 hypothetical protein OGAPHI_000303 [Ogataea philodendri]